MPQLTGSRYRHTSTMIWRCVCAAVTVACTLSADVVLAPGTRIFVRLTTPVSSNASKPGQRVEAAVIVPALIGGDVVIPAGATLSGTVAEAKPAVKEDSRAVLSLHFDSIAGPQDKPLTIKSRIADVDNARETVDESGRIIGIVASETFAARIDQGIGKVAEKHSGLAGVLEAARSAVITGKPTGEINYAPGVEMTIELTDALRWPGEPQELAFPAAGDPEGLYQLVNSQPYRTVAEKPPKPSDITNLMFIGTEQQLRGAFEAAGWSAAHELNAESALETVRAIAELRGYKEAPMSHLLLDRKRSDLDYQKGNNTFEKRHHLRIWRRPDTWQGTPVWVCAATHDIGIELSQENATFIHTINSRIDEERAKVVADLMFAKRVKSMALVERPEVPRTTMNATGDTVETDARMAVIILQ